MLLQELEGQPILRWLVGFMHAKSMEKSKCSICFWSWYWGENMSLCVWNVSNWATSPGALWLYFEKVQKWEENLKKLEENHREPEILVSSELSRRLSQTKTHTYTFNTNTPHTCTVGLGWSNKDCTNASTVKPYAIIARQKHLYNDIPYISNL